ncbi:MAG: SRPBCC domain-containing protein [Acidimicrobiales bacterium]
MDAPVRITREIDLDLSPDELWSLLADGDRWAEWLVDDGQLVLRPGADGVVVDDGTTRHVHVHTIEHGERVTFDWWADDEHADRSHVELEVVRDGDRTGLRVTETFACAGTASARAEVSWDVRLLVLHLATCALART